MGDTLGDPVMADGIEDMKEIIKIGFLNKDVCIMYEFLIVIAWYNMKLFLSIDFFMSKNISFVFFR